MSRFAPVVLCALLSGCFYVSKEDRAQRKDLDGDGIPNTEDCGPEDSAVGRAGTWFADSDADGLGDPDVTETGCQPPEGFVATGDDCDDSDTAIGNGDTDEVCDGVDNDCDGDVDEDVLETFYADDDGDGRGDPDETVQGCSPPSGYVDNDDDCDDGAEAVYDGADEICDGFDNDCDDKIDDDDPGVTGRPTWHPDDDDDGFGSDEPALAVTACDRPAGHLANADDCADADNARNPDALEICNGVDDDCDGDTDDADADVIGQSTWYLDDDDDGFGDSTTGVDACLAPSDHVADKTDCDDADNAVFPDAIEVCGDGVDNDCNTLADDNDPGAAFVQYYRDADADLAGDPTKPLIACTPPAGYVDDASDCDDTDDQVLAGADEVCDGVDNDCDGLIDATDPSVDPLTLDDFYADLDGDGFGDVATAVTDCAPPPGYVTDATDCDDTAALTYPGAVEQCDAVDNDCDVAVDEDITFVSWYRDADADGFGDDTDFQVDCLAPAGHVPDPGDCNDGNAAINPSELEVCNTVDDDCDALIDDLDPDGQIPVWHPDTDGDGFGDPDQDVLKCDPPIGTVADATDCDDTVDTINPAADEVCNGVDDNCDLAVDDADPAVTGRPTWYADRDTDGFGDETSGTAACNAPTDYIDLGGDCDDLDDTVRPGASLSDADVGDGIDRDCNGAEECFEDGDDDGFGDVIIDDDGDGSCDATGEAQVGGDCDDTAAAAHPTAPVVVGDGLDNDCIGGEECFADGDDDQFGTSTVIDDDGDGTCDGVGEAPAEDDCDDANDTIFPGAPELCDALDNDCNGQIDENAPETWYEDVDDDGFGDPSSTTVACNPPPGFVFDATDCNDARDDIFPGAPELCDGDDNDCDGQTDEEGGGISWYADVDLDGFGDPDDAVIACAMPPGRITDGTDCDDTLDTVFPGATVVVGDGIDQDCDGTEECYEDVDMDGFGDAIVSDDGDGLCVAATEATVGGDCADADDTVFPGAALVPGDVDDGLDRDCDGVDECYRDNDGDGYGTSTLVPDDGDGDCNDPGEADNADDCNDAVGTVFPGAILDPTHVGDGIDQDCDGLQECFVDDDQDGFGSPTIVDDDGDGVCTVGSRESLVSTDCNDSANDVRPGVVVDSSHVGDGVDQDCNAFEECFADLDGDGVGSGNLVDDDGNDVCTDPGEASTSGDCNDGDADVNPSIVIVPGHVGDGLDQDCDGFEECFFDFDDDGYGDDAIVYVADDGDGSCNDTQEALNTDDCDDTAPDIHPNVAPLQAYVQDGTDQDCDTFDECWGDGDGDGIAGQTLIADDGDGQCDDAGESTVAGDCDDTDDTVFPGATLAPGDAEDGVDQNCDGVDECHQDSDGDGFGKWNTFVADDGDGVCDGTGEAPVGTDCIDFRNDIYPGAPILGVHVGDGLDQDCDLRDECYGDSDGDGQGGATTFVADDGNFSCTDAGEFLTAQDCDDTDDTVFFGATLGAVDAGDGIDRDCDGFEECIDDADGDTYGTDLATVIADDGNGVCTDSGESLSTDDCDDALSAVNPGASEDCFNGIDDNCNGLTDSADAGCGGFCFEDLDGDGFGSTVQIADTGTAGCTDPGESSVNTDCADGDDTVFPGATLGSIDVQDGVDRDCNGFDECFADVDDDTFGSDLGTLTDDDGNGVCSDLGESSTDDDCTDTDDTVFPGASVSGTDVGDGVDRDCNGFEECFTDGDTDTHGALPLVDDDGNGVCTDSGEAVTGDDCDDTADTVSPSGTEDCQNGIDDDCDGRVDLGDDDCADAFCFEDADGDGFGTTTVIANSGAPGCTDPGESAVDTDCRDVGGGAAQIYPGAPIDAADVGDGVDDDCNGFEECYLDQDDDGQATPNIIDDDGNGVCTDPGEATIASPVDCGPSDPTVYVGAPEVCDGVDNNCNGQIDEGACSCSRVTNGSSTYLFCGTDLWWSAARSQCLGWGYDLATVNDQAENVWLEGQISGDEHHWIGYQDTDGDSVYGWSDGTPAGYENWGGAPTADECARLRQDNGLWESRDCNNILVFEAYICEVDCPPTNWYYDGDGDGVGSGPALSTCVQPTGWVPTDGDCDDTNAAVLPGAPKIAGDGVDNDCDGLIECFVDGDGDGYGAGLVDDDGNGSCTDGTETDIGGDCLDSEFADNPGAVELCSDGRDNDCDGDTDTDDFDCIGAGNCFADIDNDGFGTTAVVADDGDGVCDDPGESTVNTDCAPSDATAWPGAPILGVHVDDGVDQDCDGVDECFGDTDGDGYADTATLLPDDGDGDCDDPGEYLVADDCDPTNAAIHPGALEVCNAADDDCNGIADDGAGCGSGNNCTDYSYNGDTYLVCTTNQDWVDAENVCSSLGYHLATIDDAGENGFLDPLLSNNSWIGANDLDDDSTHTWSDGTALGGYQPWRSGDPSSGECTRLRTDGEWGSYSCTETADFVCELNCATGSYYVDADGDGFGDPNSTPLTGCTIPSGYVVDAADCDDTNATVNPLAPVVVEDGVDQDCDGLDECWADGDGDGWGTTATADDGDGLCDDAGEASVSGDCDDVEFDDNPAASEQCGDGRDNDCDGMTDGEDFDCLPPMTCFQDDDGDGFGTTSTIADDGDGMCDDAGESTFSTDCDDGQIAIFPGAPIVPADVDDGTDQDCDGFDECYADNDGDGDGDVAQVIPDDGDFQCDDPGESGNNYDCDDNDTSSFHGAPCDDGQACTANDTCAFGVCTGFQTTACGTCGGSCAAGCPTGNCCTGPCPGGDCTCQAGCSCDLDCSQDCQATCEAGSICNVDPDDNELVDLTCEAGATCFALCDQGDQDCAVTCEGDSVCDVTCDDERQCEVDCTGNDAACSIQCFGGDSSCTLGNCSEPMSCGNGLEVCNRPCP